MKTIGEEFLTTVIRRLKYYKELAEKAFDQLDEQQLRYQPNEESNSIAIIVQHMAGNMLSRWTNFLAEDGEKEWRKRDEEFMAFEITREQILELWEKGWNCFFDTLNSLKEADLLKKITIRNEELTAIDAINRQLAHYPHHIGQILYIGKLLKNERWQNLSIPRDSSSAFNKGAHLKDPAKKY
jgi:hypothetical protein